MRSTALPTAVRWSHLVLGPRLAPGDVVVDATAGNGNDTVFLARRVLPGGCVFAFDIQQSAVEATRARLIAELPDMNLAAITVYQNSHADFPEKIPTNLRGAVRAFMFNLGFLPGGDKTLITQTESTLTALQTAAEWLAPDGLITVTAYPGHAGGDEEAQKVERWMAGLSSDIFETQKIGFLNFRSTTPFLMVLRKKTQLLIHKESC